MRVTRWIWYTLSLVIVASMAALAVYWPVIGKTAEPAPVSRENVLDHVGVVDIDRLVQASADAPKLAQIDQEIAYVSQELETSGPNQEDLLREAKKRLDAQKKTLEDQFSAEVARVKSDLDAKKAAVEATLKAKADGIASQMRTYQDELKKKAGIGAVPDAGTRRQLERQMRDSQEPLRLVVQAKLASKQLDLQQQVKDTMADAKRTMEQRVASQMDGVLRADQAEKLQLQLDMKTASDEDQRKKLQDKLQAITDREESKRDVLRKQLAADYDATRKKAVDHMRDEMNRYTKIYQDQVRAQHPTVEGGSGGSVSAATIKGLQQSLEARERELKAQFEVEKNGLVGQLRAASDVAQAHLKDEQQKVVQKLKDLQQRIYRDIVKTEGTISKDEQARRDRLKAQLDELKAQRDRVYEGIVDQIRNDVSKVAAQQNVPLVVGGYRVNLHCQDLTEMALKQVASSTAGGTPASGH